MLYITGPAPARLLVHVASSSTDTGGGDVPRRLNNADRFNIDGMTPAWSTAGWPDNGPNCSGVGRSPFNTGGDRRGSLPPPRHTFESGGRSATGRAAERAPLASRSSPTAR